MSDFQKIIFPFLLVLFEMATYLSNDMYLPALPAMMHELSIPYHQAQLALTAWFFGSISAQVILGPLSERYGRKSILCIGVLLFLLSTLFCALAANLQMLLIGRFVQGTGLCFISVPGYASIHESFEQKKAIRLLALMASIAVLAPAFGPLLGSIILAVANWRWIFGFLVVWSGITFILLLLWMPETLPPEKRLPLAIAPALKSYASILTNKQFLKLMMILGLIFCGFITWIAAGPFVIIEEFKQKPLVFGILQILIFACYITSNNLVKYMMEWIGIEKMIRLGLHFIFLGSILALLFAILFPDHLAGIIISFMIFAFGSGLVSAPLNRLIIETSDAPMGARMAVFSMFVSGFATLATVLVGIFYNNTLLSLALLLFIITLLARLLSYNFKQENPGSHGNI